MGAKAQSHGSPAGECKDRKTYGQRAKRPPKNPNALQAGIKEFLSNSNLQPLLSELGLSIDELTSALPKRFNTYEPLLLLPANTFQAPPAWGSFYAALTPEQREALYASIAKHSRRLGVTHIAVNAPIALTNKGEENRIRSPAGLIPLYGDFGDTPSSSATGEENARPSKSELERAFWVRTVQNHGIVQIWAPLYTMFSRGNITEKARILGQGPSQDTFAGLDEGSLQGQSVADISVVDMYAGIGYFVFSYLKRGVRRVWGWELNGWSVEGLRRGCEANRWGCRVICVQQDGKLDMTVEELTESLTEKDRVVIFHGDNRFAADILTTIQSVMESQHCWNPIRHANLGLLPSSRPSWDNACRVLDADRGGWIHVHENVDVREIEEKKVEIMTGLRRLRHSVHLGQGISEGPVVNCCHVEHVKTYAPGVMHCVFDMHFSGSKDCGK